MPGHHPGGTGIVSFITVAGFLNGPGFKKMRSELRRQASDIWVIDCTPEGHQPPIGSRIFQGVQQPVCIVMAARRPGTGESTPARVHFRSLPEAGRAEKFEALAGTSLHDDSWTDCPSDWRAPFLPRRSAEWAGYPALDQLFDYDGSGVMPGRTWVIAPDTQSLEARWKRLQAETDPNKKEMLFHPHLRGGKPGDKHLNKVVKEGLTGHRHAALSVANDKGPMNVPQRYGFRSFDRQWIIPDARLINQANPNLWATNSPRQIYATAPHDRTPTGGPALAITSLIPDLHHYNGRGGRVFPLWADSESKTHNFAPGIIAELSAPLGFEVTPEDLFAYIAAVAAHPDYTARFAKDLKQPGLRIPLTVDADLFAQAVRLGREIVWLHTFGDRFADPAAGRPAGAPRMPEYGPVVSKDGTIPDSPERFPQDISYNGDTRRLHVGDGYIDNVSPAMWTYEISGVPVIQHWFSYRRRDRERPVIGDRRPPSPLGRIQPEAWLAEYTSELVNVLHILGRLVALEPQQAELLKRIVSGPTLTTDRLREAGVIAEVPS